MIYPARKEHKMTLTHISLFSNKKWRWAMRIKMPERGRVDQG